MNRRKILIVAGEPSGDIHASNLINDLKSLKPDLAFFGIGGDLMKKSGSDIIFDISELALVGLTEVLKNIFTVRRAFNAVLSKVDSDRPDIAILVDYPGFNLRLAKELENRSIPVIYYISPQVWAWGGRRVKLIKKYVKKMVVFFKFEEELYKDRGIDAEFVGNPLLDTVRVTSGRDATLKRYGLPAGRLTISLLPGSRANEIRLILPVMAQAAKIIQDRLKDVQFIAAKHPGMPADPFREEARSAGIDLKLVEGDTYNMLAASDFAIVKSGTSTLETAIVGTPLMLVYRASFVTYLAYNMVSKTPFVGLPNVVAGRKIIPELLQYEANPKNIAETAISILQDKNALLRMREDLKAVKASLGSPGASMRAAKSILPFLK